MRTTLARWPKYQLGRTTLIPVSRWILSDRETNSSCPVTKSAMGVPVFRRRGRIGNVEGLRSLQAQIRCELPGLCIFYGNTEPSISNGPSPLKGSDTVD